MSGRLAGKRALVTGAASGIGKATAIAFAVEDARVALVDLDPTGLQNVERSINEDGGAAESFVADVADEAQIATAVRSAEDALAGLDTVIANAAVHFPDRARRVHELQLDAWTKTIEVNLTGAFLTCKYGIPCLLRNGGGSVVCTGSPNGLLGMPTLAAYSSSKAGLSALVRVIAAEYAEDGIRANAVIPGLTATPFVERLRQDAERWHAVEGKIPLRRAARPAEIASMMVFLASDEASYATGALFTVDGGRTAV
jgi:NAD(P)-dependent dehydrogenase (short-subunit alcohol dehydrogenase family)